MNRRRCSAYGTLLVDYADGALDAVQQQALERHLTECRSCTAELAALRELPAALRTEAVTDPGEEFWRRQRQEIGRAIRKLPEPRRTWQLDWWRATWWRYPVALAASAAVALLVYRLAARVEPPQRPESEAQVASLDNEAVLTLREMMQVLVPQDEYLPQTMQDDQTELAALPLSDLAGVRVPLRAPSLGDLDDTEIDGLGSLIGIGDLNGAGV